MTPDVNLNSLRWKSEHDLNSATSDLDLSSLPPPTAPDMNCTQFKFRRNLSPPYMPSEIVKINEAREERWKQNVQKRMEEFRAINKDPFIVEATATRDKPKRRFMFSLAPGRRSRSQGTLAKRTSSPDASPKRTIFSNYLFITSSTGLVYACPEIVVFQPIHKHFSISNTLWEN